MVQTLVLNTGAKIPMLGFGTWKLQEGEQAYQAVKCALETGYRHIDTAQIYGNEESVGKAIRDSKVKREELFLTTKIWNDRQDYEGIIESIEQSLERLQVDYVDLLLIHWPNPSRLREVSADKWREVNRTTWQAMEQLHREGKLKAIGVSNFMTHHLEDLLTYAEVVPAVNQILIAPGCVQADLVTLCRKHQIAVEAYSPFGSGTLFENQEVLELAQRYQVTPAQLVLSWLIQNEFIPLPRSSRPENIVANFDVPVLDLTPEEQELLANLKGIAEQSDPDQVSF